MSAKNSHLTIRQDLVEENLSVPVRFLDYQEESWITDSDTLNIDEEYVPENGEQLDDISGYNMIIKVTDLSQKDQYGDLWKDRLAFAISADFDWN